MGEWNKVVGESSNAASIKNSFEWCEFVSFYRMQAIPAIFLFLQFFIRAFTYIIMQ